jgi:hypothetical protein
VKTFAELGVTVTHSFQTTTVSAGGVDLSNNERTKIEMVLPRPSPVRASFRKESWGDAVVKVFKKELQTGDPDFDKLVYISTDTPEATAAFLKPDDIRAKLGLCIETGGSLEVDGTRVVAVASGHDRRDDPALVDIVRALLG